MNNKFSSSILFLTLTLSFIHINAYAQTTLYDKNLDKLVASLVSGMKDKSVKKVAVANFYEMPSRQRYRLSDVLEDDLTTKLIETSKFDVIVKSRTDEILKELKFGNSGLVDPLKVKKFGQFSEVDAILMGSYRQKGKDIIINVQLIKVETMEAAWGGSIEIPIKEFPADLLEFLNTNQEAPQRQLEEKEIGEIKRTFGIGIGNPYLSLLYNPSRRVTLELKYVSDFVDTSIFAARVYLNYGRFYFAGEYGKILFSVSNSWAYSYTYTEKLSGYMIGVYLGCNIRLSRYIDLNIDAGPVYYDLDNDYLTDYEWVINTGLRFWL